MVELLKLYATFFYLGIVNFGGGYAMLPLLERELVDKRKWCTVQDLADYYAIGQCTPGAIAVNVSTFIGHKRKGILGGIFATLGFVSPAFIIIFVIASVLTNFADNEYVKNALAGINVCVFFLVIFAVSKLFKKSIKDIWTLLLAIGIALLSIFVSVIPLYAYVIFAGVYGVLVCYLKQRHDAKKKAPQIKAEETPVDAEANNCAAEETSKEEIKEEKETIEVISTESSEASKSSFKSDALYFSLGVITGLLIGVLGFVPYIFVRNKKYRNGFVAALVFWLIMLACTLVTIFTQDPTMFSLYFNFFRIGVCAFGGGLATIPFLYELGEMTSWFNAADVTNMIAVAESTPGAMGINMSTYVGYTVGFKACGYPGAIIGSMVGTLGLVTPSIIVIEIICLFLDKFKENKYVKWTMYGLCAGSIGLIIRAAYSILIVSLFKTDIISAGNNITSTGFLDIITEYFNNLVNWKSLGVGLLFGIAIFKFKKHPIIYIAIAAAVGILLQMAV